MTSSPLLQQLAHRAIAFHQSTNISRAQMAQAIGTEPANYSAFLNGKRGLAAESVCALLKFTSMTQRQAIAAFSEPARSSKILRLQEKGKRLQFDNSGWVSREGGTDDPVNSTDISTTPRARTQQVADLTAVFQDLDYVTRKNVIDAFIAAHTARNTIPTKQQFNRQRRKS